MTIYIYTYRYVLPGSDLDGETLAVRATCEADALLIARSRADYVTRRMGLALESVEPTRYVTGVDDQ